MIRTEDFFIPDNKVILAEELDYSRVDEYIRSAEAFSRSTYQSVYIIDYFKQNFLYVSPKPWYFVLSPEEIKELGYLKGSIVRYKYFHNLNAIIHEK